MKFSVGPARILKAIENNIYDKIEPPINPNGVRKVKKIRLVQVDIAVRDSRNDAVTGLVFGTFTYKRALKQIG
jgi:hypothetical protein